MRRLHRAIAILLCAAVVCGLSSCAQTSEKPQERIVVRLAAPQNSFIEDFETNQYKLWLEEQTGLKIEMTWLPMEDAEQIVRQQLQSGEGLPDAYIGFGSDSIFKPANIEAYGETGKIIPLTALIETEGVYIGQVFDELEDYHVRELMTSPDGEIYYMPGFSYSLITRYSQIMWINKGWLNELGISIPTTTDDFRDMLYAFKTLDPNGNGANDEIPMAGTEAAYSKQCYDYLINSFVYNDPKNSRLIIANGQVGFAPATNEWRDAMLYLSELYDEELFSPISFEQDEQGLIQMANDPRDILGAFTSSGVTTTVLQNSPEVLSRYIGLAPLTGPDGVRYSTISAPLPKPNGVITSACKNPELVFKLFDLMLSEEACLMGRYGEQGVDWDFAEDGQASIYGTPATIEIKQQIWNTLQNKHLMQIGPYISRAKYSGGVTWDGNTVDGEYMNAQTALLFQPYEPSEYISFLPYYPGEEETIAEIRAAIESYVQNSIRDFITGKRDIHSDTEWNAYINRLDALGLQEYVRMAQTAYDRVR